MTIVVDAPRDVDERADHALTAPTAPTERFPAGTVAAAIAVSVLLRARFLTTPLTSDEGGYLAVARAWASGKGLYTQAWVDRPQGLLVLFRAWDALTGGSPAAIRAMAMVFGCLVVAGVGYTVFAVAGARAAGAAALLVAVASANAHIEGFIANGELLAGGVASLGVAAACASLFRGHRRRWLFVSGVLAGLAMSLKQSGFDGFAAVAACIVVAGLTHERAWRSAIRDIGLLAAGLCTVVAALFVHGLIVGFGAWWYAVAGYRLEGVNGTSGDWHRFADTAAVAAPTIRPLVAVAALGLITWLVRSRRLTASIVLIPAWVCFAVLGFLAGGLFHRHYWVMLTFPLAAAAALPIARLTTRLDVPHLTVAVACAIALPSFVDTVHVAELDRAAVAMEASGDPRLIIDEKIGTWFREHRTPTSTLFAMCASAGLYATADTASPYPYLWEDGVLHARQSQARLVDMFAGDDAPTFVAEYQHADSCNPSGVVESLLAERYDVQATVHGIRILMLRDTPRVRPTHVS